MRRGVLLCTMCLWMACPGSLRQDGGVRPDTAWPVVDLPPSRDRAGGDRVFGNDQRGDLARADTLFVDGPVACSIAGVPSVCQVHLGTGCLVGACYLLKNVGPACVCPPGNLPLGQACTSTSQCAPGLGCNGVTPPGKCARVCLTAAPSCGAAQQCTPIPGYAQYGFCLP